MATSAEAKTRNRIKSIVDAISGGPVATVSLGVRDIGPTEEFLRTLGSYTVTNKALTSNVATITIGTHKLIVGQRVKVALTPADATLDGVYAISAATSTTISYAKTAGNIVSASTAGTVSGGPCLCVRPARTSFKMTTLTRTFVVVCELWFGFAANASYDFTAIEDVLYSSLLPALTTESNYSDVGPPMDVQEIEEPEIDKSQDPIVGKYQITLSFKGC
jgi:hypothetical protein